MAGVCGYAGEHPEDVNFGIDLTWTGREFERTFEDECVQVSQCGHSDDVGDQPIDLQTGEKLWIWGDVYGHRAAGEYTSRRASGLTKLAFVERALGRDWRTAVRGLNGSFVLVVYDSRERQVHLVTDKVGSRSMFYTSTRAGLVFSPRLQSIYLETDLSPSVDQEHLQAFFSGLLSGIYTPIQDTFLCHPGSILTYDIRSGDRSVDTYWRPSHDPVDESAEWFAEEFVRRLQAAVEDRIGGYDDVSLLLSGGGDSRLLAAVLDSLDVDYRAYHATSWESSHETTIARCVADRLEADLEVLSRDSDHFAELTGEAMELYSFQGLFEQAHLEPQMDEIAGETELLFSGDFADPTFKGKLLPKERTGTQVDNVQHVGLGGFRLKDFVRSAVKRGNTPYYFTGECQSPSATVHQNVHRRGDDVVNHGITLDSAEDLFLSYGFYPSKIVSQYFRHSLLEHTRLRTPYVDDRLLDLYLKTPTDILFERNVMNMALSELDPALSVIANASTALPPVVKHEYHESIDLGPRELNVPEPPEDWQGHDPWGYEMYDDDLIRQAILENQEVVESASFLDDELLLGQTEGRSPWGGSDRYEGYQYRVLLSFICAPIAEQLV